MTRSLQLYCVRFYKLIFKLSDVYSSMLSTGAPDTPQDVELVSVQFPDAKTVSVNVSWMPGYNGGFRQEFSIHYKRKSVGDFTEEYVGNPHNSMYTVRQLRPETEYQFMVQATNERGKSAVSPLTQVMTIGW